MLERVTRIENAGPDLRARRIFFEDDAQFRITASTVVKKLGIVEGLEVERTDFERALCAEELPMAKERALQLLGYRERSRFELARKLAESGFPAGVVSAVVDRFTDVELVDDERFACAWVRARRSAGYGDRRIRRELEEKGIGPQLACLALGVDDSVLEIERAIDSLRGRRPIDGTDTQRLIRRLLSRGFSAVAARAAVDHAQSASGEDFADNSYGDTADDLQ